MAEQPDDHLSPGQPSTGDLYDEVAYPSVPFGQTHPDRLAVLAALYGLSPAPVERCRVLELGGGDGSNLIPMALALPEAEFLGIDLAPDPIARGQRTVEALGLTNVTLRCLDLLDLARDADAGAETAGRFDYIIAHGVYSWVPEPVREATLTIMGRLLSPHGVGFVSFNALPGAAMRKTVREMLLYHEGGPGASAGSGAQRVERAQGFARLLTDGMVVSEDTVSMRASLRTAADRQVGVLFHDELAPAHQPFYLHEVIERAADHGLQFLADADFPEMQDYAFAPEVRELLARVEQERGRVAREQHLDFLKFRQFRQVLLCRAEVPLTRTPDASDARRFLAASPMQPVSPLPDLRPGVVEPFHGPRQASVRLDLPLAKAAFIELGDAWPGRLSFEELAERSAARLATRSLPSTVHDEHQGLHQVLFDGYRAGLIQLYAWHPTLATRPGVRPKLSPLARVQIEDGGAVISTLLQEFVVVESPLTRHLMRLLDGTRDRAALLSSLRTWSRRQRSAQPSAGSGAPAESEITLEGLEEKLWELARHGLLVA